MAYSTMDELAETWKPVEGFEDRYEVSSEGRVRCLDYVCSMRQKSGQLVRQPRSGQVLKQTLFKGKYYGVGLSKDGSRKIARTNRLVCAAFHGPAPSALHIALHNNGDSKDNRATNLRWGTHKLNADDRESHGRTARGERQHSAKLTAGMVRDLRAGLHRGSVTEFAREVGMDRSTIYDVIAGRTWKHV